jgi:cytochrome c-type protein NapC
MSALDPATPRRSWLARIWAFVVELWDVLRRPSSVFGLGVLVLAGFVAGVVFWGGFNTTLELTNTEKFCTGCHEMRDNVFAELKTTIHFSNRSGVRASCPDCHVPHNWTDKIARKMQASKEVWGHLFGSINTREKFVDNRLELALHEWARLKANDSLECRLPQRGVDGYHQAVATRFRCTPALPVPHRKDLHRLPQGHRAPSTGYARRSWLAIATQLLRLSPQRIGPGAL